MRCALIITVVAWASVAEAQERSPPSTPLPDGVRELIARIEARGLPADRLETKAREGIAKHVPMPRVVAVLDVLSQHIEHAAAIVDAGHHERALTRDERRATINAMTSALENGVSDKALEALNMAATKGNKDPLVLRRAVAAVTDLTVQGYGQEKVGALVISAVEKGYRADDFPKLVTAINELAAHSDKTEVLDILRGVVERGAFPDSLRSPAAGSTPPPAWAGRSSAPEITHPSGSTHGRSESPR
jgi:hypothetical protein